MDEEKKVKCADCGLLALRKGEIDELPILPTSLGIRRNGVVAGGQLEFDHKPYCCINEHPINDQCDERNKESNNMQAAFRETIQAERTCAEFTEWIPSLTPKEHIEMNILQRQREEIEKRRKADEDFRNEIRNEDLVRNDRIRMQSEELAKDHRKIDLQYKELEKEMRAIDYVERGRQWSASFWWVKFGICVSALIGATSVGISLYTATKPSQPPTIINEIKVTPPAVINQITIPPPTSPTK